MIPRFRRGRGAFRPAALVLFLGCLAVRASATDVLYVALHGQPESVTATALTGSPGLYVGHAVRTQARVTRWDAAASAFEIDLGGQPAVLRLEPEAQATVASRPAAWVGRTLEVEGLFYRDARDSGPSPYAIRAWSIGGPGAARTTTAATPAKAPVRLADAPLLSLEDLVYANGRYDGRPVRIRGLYRGANVARDLPESTRRGGRDWVIKDGYFAAWVTGREARGDTWDLTSVSSSTAVLEIAGVPTTSRGVVRILAQAIDLAPADDAAAAVQASATPRDARGAGVPVRVSFLYPVPGEAPGARGSLVLQFNKAMDPRSFENRVRVRYEKSGDAFGTPRVAQAYRDRYRALVLSPTPPPPPGADVVVELLEGVIDVDGNGIAGETRFRSAR